MADHIGLLDADGRWVGSYDGNIDLSSTWIRQFKSPFTKFKTTDKEKWDFLSGKVDHHSGLVPVQHKQGYYEKTSKFRPL